MNWSLNNLITTLHIKHPPGTGSVKYKEVNYTLLAPECVNDSPSPTKEIDLIHLVVVQ